MEPTVLVAIISALGTAFGTFAGIMINSKLVNYRIEQLEKKVDKHNNVIERVYELEKKEAVVEKDMRVANHRIDDLEEFHK